MVFMFCCFLCNLRGVCAVGVCAFFGGVGGGGVIVHSVLFFS